MSASWFREHASSFSGELRFDEPLSKHTYYRIGGPADVFAVPKSIEDLAWLREGLRHSALPLFVLGAGSNLLVSDGGFRGLVLSAKKLNVEIAGVSDEGERVRIRTGSGAMISTLLRRAAQEGWAGFELLAGVPGTVGGAAVMNAGTHLGESKDLLQKVEVFPLLGEAASDRPVVYEGSQLKYAYRRNDFIPKGSLIWAVEWLARKEKPEAVKARIDDTLARRKQTQPIDFPSCGSVFKNPKTSGLSAWQVIERLGLRGHRIGGAVFSEKHCNFIVNEGDARATDVRGLIELAKSKARDELGIALEEEVLYLGEWK